MKNWKKYTFYVSVIIIGFLIGWFTDDSESENPVVEEKVVQLTYKDYENEIDINCWKTFGIILYTVPCRRWRDWWRQLSCRIF